MQKLLLILIALFISACSPAGAEIWYADCSKDNPFYIKDEGCMVTNAKDEKKLLEFEEKNSFQFSQNVSIQQEKKEFNFSPNIQQENKQNEYIENKNIEPYSKEQEYYLEKEKTTLYYKIYLTKHLICKYHKDKLSYIEKNECPSDLDVKRKTDEILSLPDYMRKEIMAPLEYIEYRMKRLEKNRSYEYANEWLHTFTKFYHSIQTERIKNGIQ